MRRIKLLSAIVALIYSLLVGNFSYAEEDVNIMYNGQKVKFDVKPYIKNGRTLVPFRKVFEVLGADVSWNSSSKTVTAKKGATEIILRLGDKNATVNGKNKTLEVPPSIIDGRTVVPLRFVSENCGAKVEWVGESKTAYISTQGMTCH